MAEISRLRADNPSRLTGNGTNTWIYGERELVVIDPGPDLPAHLERVAAEVRRRGRAAMVAVTHHHPDHREGAATMAAMLDVPIALYHEEALSAGTMPLRDGDRLLAGGGELTVLHTPGHASDHLCFWAERERVVFTGDHVLQGTTSVIAPPDGDMARYMRSLAGISRLGATRLLPGHGEPIEDAAAALRTLIAHREEREAQIVAELGSEPRTILELVNVLYSTYPPEVLDLAALTVHAHLIKLEREGRVSAQPDGYRLA